MPDYFLGLDLGGTNVKAGLVSDSGKILEQISIPTGSKGRDLAPAPVIARMISAGNHSCCC